MRSQRGPFRSALWRLLSGRRNISEPTRSRRTLFRSWGLLLKICGSVQPSFRYITRARAVNENLLPRHLLPLLGQELPYNAMRFVRIGHEIVMRFIGYHRVARMGDRLGHGFGLNAVGSTGGGSMILVADENQRRMLDLVQSAAHVTGLTGDNVAQVIFQRGQIVH